MSTTDNKTDAEAFGKLLRAHKPGSGPDRYARFSSDVLGITRTWVLDQISEALSEHEQVLAIGGNGVGKSLGTSILGVSALFCNPDTVVQITAGNGKTVENSIWAPAKKYWRRSGLPGKKTDNDRKLLPFPGQDEEWFLQCQSPKAPGDLEGDHNGTAFVVIEEAEKPGITKDHIDAARSVTTEERDRVLVLANPPTDEGNVVSKLANHDEWHVLKFPSWESHNVRIERGVEDGEKIGGLTTTYKIRQDWNEYHDDPWPGLERAIEVSSPYLTKDGELTVYETDTENPEFRNDLHERWYKRRAGIIPPEGSDSWRPWSIGDVEAAYRREVENVRITPAQCGIDVARSGGDKTVMIGLHDGKAIVEYEQRGDNHHSQRLDLQDDLKEWPDPDVNVDAVGEGSGLADELDARLPNINRFGNGEQAVNDDYRFKWDEGLQLIGEWLRDGGSFDHPDLYTELKVAASVVTFSERNLNNRGKVIEATPKDEVKQELGHSPDYLDSLLMAVMAKEVGTDNGKADAHFSW